MSKNKIAICLVLVGLLALGGNAFAEWGTIDPVPAATLLLPYFGVDLSGSGITTLFSINNASAAPALAHVTLWSEYSVPVLDFDVYLTGFDVQTINLRDVIVDGLLPQTGENAPKATLEPGSFPAGRFSVVVAGTDFAGCSTATTPGTVPIYVRPLGLTFRDIIQEALSGQIISAGAGAGRCASLNVNTGLARGYITIDSVSNCSQEFPSSTNYFINGGTGTANNNNVLWGDWFYIDDLNDSAVGNLLVHIEASPPGGGPRANPTTCVAGAAGCGLGPNSCDTTDFNPTTFYCRYTTAAPNVAGEDNREALPSLLGTRFITAGAFTGGTALYVYRDPNTAAQGPVTCGTIPTAFNADTSNRRMNQRQIIVFDECENPIIIEEGPSGFDPEQERPFPFETNCTLVGPDLSVGTYTSGWVYLNLNSATRAAPMTDPLEYNQAWDFTQMSALERFSVGFDAINFNNLSLGTMDTDDCLLGDPPPACSITNP